MSWQQYRRIGKILLPINVLAMAAVAFCLYYPLFRLRVIEVVYTDGREVTEGVYEQVCRAVIVSPDSNLISIEREKIAEELMRDENIAGVDVRLALPDRLVVRLHPAQPALWLAEDGLLPIATDGGVVSSDDCLQESGFPVGSDLGEGNTAVRRWRLVEFYRELTAHDPRWADVISQIVCDSVTGWQLVLNGGAERILLGLNPDSRTFSRVVQFLETVSEARWKNGTIDARFDGNIILTPCNEKPHRTHTSVDGVDRRSGRSSYGGEGTS